MAAMLAYGLDAAWSHHDHGLCALPALHNRRSICRPSDRSRACLSAPLLTLAHPAMNRLIRPAFWSACLAVAVLSLLPAEQLPAVAFNWWDKAQHALGFALLGVLGLLGYRQRPRRVVWGLLVFGGLIELAQAATGWRYGDWQDWLADALGVAGAWGLLALWHKANSTGPRDCE